MNHPDIPKEALFVTCTNKDVNEFNESKLEMLDGTIINIESVIVSSLQKKVNPKTSNDGSIFNTPLQKVLRLKVGAKVMLTYNVDVMDCLTNGAMGEVINFLYDEKGCAHTILVHFYDEKVGKNIRKKYPALQFNNISVTPIGGNFETSDRNSTNQNALTDKLTN